tara:strand:- start:1172 stop:1276 length:105 start_codon:yes stop_codon:yes gene_type:complete
MFKKKAQFSKNIDRTFSSEVYPKKTVTVTLNNQQ